MTIVDGQDPNQVFGLPECDLLTQDPLWSGRAAGERLIASRTLVADCPAEGRVQVTVRAEGPRTTVFET